MTYAEFIASLHNSGCSIRLQDGSIYSLEEWRDNLADYGALQETMHGCEVTLVWP